jgi:hypothetical protein
MHLLIPYAASHADACLATLPTLKLPHLQKLLNRLTALPLDAGDELSLSPPHERALAKLQGLPALDGQIPWAALQSGQRTELAHLKGAWGFVTLCNWQATAHQVSMRQLPMHDLPQAESDQFLASMQPFFAEDGITLYPFEPGRWLALGDVFADLPSASPDRVLGRNLEPWMPKATRLVRLVSEMQMLLYTHPANDLREQRGTLPVNAFWLSGTGAASGAAHKPGLSPPTIITPLRDAALADNWHAWVDAWQALDASHGQAMLAAHARGDHVQLTLCGERHAQTWHTQPQTLLQKVKGLFGIQHIQDVLKQL